jgi:hypothetical protein
MKNFEAIDRRRYATAFIAVYLSVIISLKIPRYKFEHFSQSSDATDHSITLVELNLRRRTEKARSTTQTAVICITRDNFSSHLRGMNYLLSGLNTS